MKKYTCILLMVSFSLNAQVLTVEKIMQDPKWIGTSPSNVFWSHDSKAVLFQWNPLKAANDSAHRYQLNNASISKFNYQDGRVAAAVNSGKYNRNRSQIVYELDGDIYLLINKTGEHRRITRTNDNESNPNFIIGDQWIAYQQGDDLLAWNVQSGSIMQLTNFVKEKPVEKKHTAQDKFLQQQQLKTSDILKQRKEKKELGDAYTRQTKGKDTLRTIYTGNKSVRGLQVSPGGQFITYNLFADGESSKRTGVPEYVSGSGYTTELKARSKVGTAFDSAVFYLFDRERDTVIALQVNTIPGIKDRPAYAGEYPLLNKDTADFLRSVNVSRVYWNEPGTVAVLDIRSGDFKDRWLMQLNTTDGSLKLLDRQQDAAWISGPGIAGGQSIAGWLNDSTIYYRSEMSGYAHVYTQNISSLKKQAITKGDFEIQELILSKDKKYFYFISNEEHPGKKNFYKANVDGTNKVKISSMTGGYEVSVSPDEKWIAYRYSNQHTPWELYIQQNAPGKTPVQVTNKGRSDEWKAYPWRDTRIFSFPGDDGKQVYARIYEPAAGMKNKAAVIFVHGAGYLQNVSYGWSSYFREYMFNNLLADQGYTVLDIDYRASAGYGRDWRAGIYRHMGSKDLADHLSGAKLLVNEYGIDSARIGIYGGSYGGFITLMALFTKPGVFKAGAALRPVTDWAHYNNGYTAAILNEPTKDSIAYSRSSPINFAAGLQDHLLICHGMVDVNVHYQDVVRLTQRLIELGKKNWELASYPVEDHAFVEPSSWTDEYSRILKLFNDHLLKP